MHEARVLVQEDRAEETDLFHGVRDVLDLNAVADVVRVLDEQEDNTREDFGQATSDEPAET